MGLNARLKGVRTLLVLGLLVLSLTALDYHNWFKGNATASFTFAAAGDFGQNANTNASLSRLASSGASLFLALGDLSYTTASPEIHWCNLIKSHVGLNYPFELLSGNHEDGGEIRPPDGFIGNFTKCLPNQIETMNGNYGKEYYFDYPTANPLARFIMISPGLNFSQPNGQFDFYSYDNGTSHYQWTASAIDGARASSIPWVIVGMHKVCLSAGAYECTIGPHSTVRPDIIQLLLQKHVDLVLQGHDHNYQRSKQLDCLLPENFQSSCVANSGSDGFYSPGAGTVFVIDGTFGASNDGYGVHLSEPDAEYFARFMAPNIDGAEYGFVMYTVSTSGIRGQTNFDGSFKDTFQIGNGGIFRTVQLFFANSYLLTAAITVAVLLVALLTIFLVRRRSKRTRSS
jgi:predicted MPP superfamily phosphohydrolase